MVDHYGRSGMSDEGPGKEVYPVSNFMEEGKLMQQKFCMMV